MMQAHHRLVVAVGGFLYYSKFQTHKLLRQGRKEYLYKEIFNFCDLRSSMMNSRGKWLLGTAQSLFTKSRNEHGIKIEAQPPHMASRPHYIDFS